MQAKNSYGGLYDCLKPWPADTFVQCGDKGIVFGSGSLDSVLNSAEPEKELIASLADKQTYITAFFEAFPKNPSCYLRGEGKTVQEAEESCWIKWESILKCPGHEFDARGRTDGYGYCKLCSYSHSDVLPILNKCCKCKVPTNHTRDHKKRYYCPHHARNKPKDPAMRKYDIMRKRRFPRKYKKQIKKSFRNAILFTFSIYLNINKVKITGRHMPKVTADEFSVDYFGMKRLIKKMPSKRF